jgi:DHA1 family bicyclomycin/chloramphenicol resistance-like MFS transporter
LALLAAVTAIGFSALHMVVPVLPVIADAFASPPSAAQSVLTLFFVGIAAGQLFYGPVSDRFGRRPVLLLGLVMFLAGTAVCAFAWSLPVLVFGRVLQALGGCAGLVLGRAIIRDVCDREGAARAIALVMMAMTLAPAACPAIGAYATAWFGWRAIFVLLGTLGLVVLAVAVRRLAETLPEAVALDLAGLARSHALLLRSRAFLCFALCSAGSSASWFVFIASAPYLLSENLHEPPATYGAMILIPMAAYMLGNAGAARFGRLAGTPVLFVAGLFVSLFAGSMMAVWCAGALSVWALFVPMAISSVGNGMSQPGALACGLSVFPRLAGTASGLMGFMQMTMSALGTLALGFLPRDSALATVAVVLAAQILALLLGLVALRPAGEPAAVRPGPISQPKKVG